MKSYANPAWYLFMVFHDFMPDIMDFGLFSLERSYSNSCLKNIVKNIEKC